MNIGVSLWWASIILCLVLWWIICYRSWEGETKKEWPLAFKASVLGISLIPGLGAIIIGVLCIWLYVGGITYK